MMRFAKYFIIYLILVSCGFQSIYVSNKSNFSFNKSNALGEIKISKEIIDNLDSLKKGDGVYELTIETFFKKNVSSKNKKGDPEVFDMSLDVNVTLKKIIIFWEIDSEKNLVITT